MERLIDLENRHLRLLRELLSAYLTDKTVWAYGSRVKWKASPTSDLDLVVWGATDLEVDNAKEAFVESDLPFTVQLLIWEDIPENFKENIRKKYVVLQEKPKLEGWREVRLGEVCEVFGGGTPSTKVPEYWDGDIPWLTPKDLSNLSERYISKGERSISDLGLARSSAKLLPEGAILLTTRAPIGYLAIAKNEISTNQGFRSLIAKKTDNLFLFYLLKRNVDYLKSQSSGTTFGELAGSTLKSLSFLFPPLPEQKAIAEVLSSLDDKIDLLHRQNKTLENLAQTLFRQWFVEEADEGWDTSTLSGEFNLTMGLSPPGKSYNEVRQGIPLFQGNADFGFRFPKNRVYTTEPERLAEKFDTLISVRAPVGELNMAQEKCCIGRGVASLRYKRNKDFYSYTYYKAKSLMNEIRQFDQEGTVFGSISKNDFENIEIVLPPSESIQKFQDNIKPIDERITSNYSHIYTLENLRDTLLSKLMGGNIRMKK